MMFRDQVGVLASWFKGWNECEQTVALLSLLKRVSRTQARFLQLCLEHSLAECTELQVLEGEANNPGEASVTRHRANYSKLCVAQSFAMLRLGRLWKLNWTKDLEVDARIFHTSAEYDSLLMQ